MLFDGVADPYAATRSGYPPEIVDFVVRTAGLVRASAVLDAEVRLTQRTSPSMARRLVVLSRTDDFTRREES